MAYSAQQFHIDDALEVVQGTIDGCISNEFWQVDYSLLDHINHTNYSVLMQVRDALQAVESPCELTVDSLTDDFTVYIEVNGQEVEVHVSPEVLERTRGCHCAA